MISSRNKAFTEYYNNHNCESRIIEDNIIDEDYAYEREIYYIDYYKSKGECFTNFTSGGEHPPTLCGEDNGMYGRKHSEETRNKISEIHKRNKKFVGEKNSQYGISLTERMDAETYSGWLEKHREAMIGSKNPQYGVSPYERIPKEKIKKWKENLSKSCKDELNGNSKKIKMYNDNFSMDFTMIKRCAEYLKENGYSRAKLSSMYGNINVALRNKTKYFGFYFKYL